MKFENIILICLVAIATVSSFVSCDQDSKDPVSADSHSYYQQLYDRYQNALENGENLDQLNNRKEHICQELMDYDWRFAVSTKSATDMSEQEQREFLNGNLSSQVLNWLEKLERYFVSGEHPIAVEQIATDPFLTTDEKQMLVAVLSGGDYLLKSIQLVSTRSVIDCEEQYRKDCNRAMQTYAISGPVASVTGGVVGLVGATAVCGLQLYWAEQDYKDCLNSQK